MKLWAELKRRNVLRAGVAWLALSWLLVSIADLLFPYLGLPELAIRGLIIGLAAFIVPVLIFAWLFELSPSGLRLDRGPDPDNPENLRVSRRTDQLIIVLVLMALGISAIRQFVVPERAVAPGDPAAVVQVPPGPAIELPPAPPWPVDPLSVAVLPFANLSPDPADAFMAEGLSEELLNVLAGIGGLRVASRTSSFPLRGEALGAREIGRRLGVALVVDGSVRRQGNQVRISAQLVRAADDQQLWSDTFDRRLDDIFELQEGLAQAIADALAEELGVRTVRVRRATADLEAYELYLRGRQLFAQRGASLMPARELLQQAVDRDPRFAEAWAVLAGIDMVLPSYFAETPAEVAHARAGQAAERALALVADQPEALAVSARLAAENGERIEALARLQQALTLDPNNANTWMWKGLLLIEAGHIAAARDAFDQARSLDPLSGIHQGWRGAAELVDGDEQAAEALLRQAHALGWRGPASAWRLKLALGQSGFGELAARRFDDWLHDDGRIDPAALPVYRELRPAFADPAQIAEARQVLMEAIPRFPEQDWTHPLLFLDLIDEALAEALRPKPRSGQIVLMMIWSPVDRAFREHPEFITFARQHGLIEFWSRHGWPDNCRPVGDHVERLECER